MRRWANRRRARHRRPKPTRPLVRRSSFALDWRAKRSHASKMQGKGGRWRKRLPSGQGSCRRCSARARRWTRCPSRFRRGRSFPYSAPTAPARPRCCACCPRSRARPTARQALWVSTCGKTPKRPAGASALSRITPCSIPTLPPSRTCFCMRSFMGWQIRRRASWSCSRPSS